MGRSTEVALDRLGPARQPVACRQEHAGRLCSCCAGIGQVSEVDQLLDEIAHHGWSNIRWTRFMSAHEQGIHRGLAIALRQLGLGVSHSRLDGFESGVAEERIELLLDTRSDLWIELLDGLVARFVRGRASGKIAVSFPAYLQGVIRHLMIRNARSEGLLPEESEAEMLRALARARSEKTAAQWIARLKSVFWQRMVHELLNSCPPDLFDRVYTNAAHVADHFFEVYLPKRVSTIPRCTLSGLAQDYMDTRTLDGIAYIGHVAPFDPSPRHRVVEGLHLSRGEDEFLSRLSRARDGYHAP